MVESINASNDGNGCRPVHGWLRGGTATKFVVAKKSMVGFSVS